MTAVDEPQATQAYDCMVLSGGGSKGAYGAGVAKAIQAYRGLRGLTNPTCYVGASAGALNACILATGTADELIRFWLAATNEAILGLENPDSRWRKLWLGATGLIGRAPSSLYGNQALAAFVRDRAKMARLHSPLIVAATDYTQGTAKAFYSSSLIDSFVAKDAQSVQRLRRLAHFRRIENDEMLVKALLASSAIPVFFPPVQIELEWEGEVERSYFVDGGVGNNTPTREAAYFLRFLEETGQGVAGTAICVQQEQPRTVQDDNRGMAFTAVLKRALDVYHYVHTRPIVLAWRRISHEVREQQEKLAAMAAWLKEQAIDDNVRGRIIERLNSDFGARAGSTRRLAVPLMVVEPSIELGDTLQFDPERARREIIHGYSDAVKMLRDFKDDSRGDAARAIDDHEYEKLMNRQILPAAASA